MYMRTPEGPPPPPNPNPFSLSPTMSRSSPPLDPKEVYELHVRAVSATNLRKVAMFGKMDPFVHFSVPRGDAKTPPAIDGDQNPVWDAGHNKFMLLVQAGDMLNVNVSNKGTVGSNTYIGRCVLPLSVLANGRVSEKRYAIHAEDSTVAGEILLRMQLMHGGERPLHEDDVPPYGAAAAMPVYAAAAMPVYAAAAQMPPPPPPPPQQQLPPPPPQQQQQPPVYQTQMPPASPAYFPPAPAPAAPAYAPAPPPQQQQVPSPYPQGPQVGYAPQPQAGYPPQQQAGYPPQQQAGYPPQQQQQQQYAPQPQGYPAPPQQQQ
jgi:hypothetical protein